MGRYLPWVLLAISVALNAFFVGGHFYARQFAEPHGMPPRGMLRGELLDRLQLTSDQRQALGALREGLRERARAAHAADRELGVQLLDELSKPQADTATIDGLLARLNERRLGNVRAALPELQRFLAGLTPEQRAKVHELAESRGPMFLLLQGPPPERRPPG